MKLLYTISNKPLSLKNRLFVYSYMSLFTAVLVFIALYLFDGKDWVILKEASLISNLLFLYGLGFLISMLFLRNEFKKFFSGDLEFTETEIRRVLDGKDVRVYPKQMLIHAKADKYMFKLIGKKRVTLLLKPLYGKRYQVEMVLLSDEACEDFLAFIQTYQQSNTPS